MSDRPSWIDYFMQVVESISQRSTCDRGKPGCVFVKDNQILATGYAGAPPGFPHCSEAGHEMEERQRFIPIDDSMDESFHEAMTEKGWLICTAAWGKKEFRLPSSQHCIRTVHAEANAILQAARRGVALEGSTVYVSMTPCRTCAMMLISIGVEKVIAGKLYQKAQESLDMFEKAGISVIHLDQTVLNYEKK